MQDFIYQLFQHCSQSSQTHHQAVRKVLLHLYHLGFSVLQACPLHQLPSILLLLIALGRQSRTRTELPHNYSSIVGRENQQLLERPASADEDDGSSEVSSVGMSPWMINNFPGEKK